MNRELRRLVKVAFVLGLLGFPPAPSPAARSLGDRIRMSSHRNDLVP